MTDDLTLQVNGNDIVGWQSISVTRGIDRMPSEFQIEMTERYTDEFDAFVVREGDPCVIKLGEDTVITGYVDVLSLSVDTNSHNLTVIGRGKCADLVDCAAEWENSQISKQDVFGICNILGKPYGITTSKNVDVGEPIPQYIFLQGMTCFQIIEHLCRIRGLLAYDLPDGNLLLTRVSDEVAATGFEQGVNIQRAFMSYSIAERYSEIQAMRIATDTFSDLGDGGNLIETVKDPNVPRHRRRIIIAESGDANNEILKARAQWEISRRYGRSKQLHVTTDSWRDGNDNLWKPNTIVPLNIPSLKIKPDTLWTISEVTYSRDARRGTVADLIIMPPEAFSVEPLLYVPVPRDVVESANR